MERLELNLEDNTIFSDDKLIIDKRISFIFGKNGTGKSTLTSIISEQSNDYDVNIFQGFEGIVGGYGKLNAVVLGEKNNDIDQKIKELELQIENTNIKIKEIENDIEENIENKDNLYFHLSKSKKEYEDFKNKIEKFYSQSAKKIKNKTNPQISPTSYNSTKFKSEIYRARLISEDEVVKNKEVIKSDEKTAEYITNIDINLNDLLRKTNEILLDKVEEREEILEISGDHNKRMFAEKGLEIHKSGDSCAFCGNIISEERYKKLLRYFSADDVTSFKSEITGHIKALDGCIEEINQINININEFYPQYYEEVIVIKDKINNSKHSISKFLIELKKASEEKLKDIFNSSPELEIQIPDNIRGLIKSYNNKAEENNSNNIINKIEEAKELLRLHNVKIYLDEFNYDEKIINLNKLETNYESNKSLVEKKEREIKELNNEIRDIKEEILILQSETKSEELLAKKINEKLYLYVNFKLEYLKDDNFKGYYKIRSVHTNKIRNITELSTGEKNIIAFLYFTHKLNDINNPNSHLNKIVVFDDPMTSNDDTMQYLIIEELNRVIKEDIRNNDRIIILTHNNHFYLNMKYKYSLRINSYIDNNFIRLESDGYQSNIRILNNKEEDFKTNYEALWQELIFIYECAPSESMLLNPIRRIIETFTKFNGINKTKMLGNVLGAEKLFNVNSHSIDDLEAELNGRTKNDIMKMMKECFEKEESTSHFHKYWDIEIG
ncbi:AAA family ATPase [Anaerococcus sp. DFU013_CI05]|uniref:AAA family ATPase n=1 Tax=Anaerococcus sp. AH8042_DFU013_CI05 TaxID=3385202 RepID=UPI003A5213AC